MPARIAIPVPTSSDPDYNSRTLPAYISALEAAGAMPVIVPLGERQDLVAELLKNVHGILLPGSRFDVDPQRFGEKRIPECEGADPTRAVVDELLLQDAFNLHKPILGICAGTQSLNVWRNGTLIQHLTTPVDHSPGRQITEAHPIKIAEGSKLASILPSGEAPEPRVNSSHHQAIRSIGDNLRVTAISPADGVVEAVELDSSDHFVLAVQWHPERTYSESALSRAIFAAFVEAAQAWGTHRVGNSADDQRSARSMTSAAILDHD